MSWQNSVNVLSLPPGGVREEIQDRHVAVVDRNQALLFESSESTRNYISYRTDVAGNLVIGETQAKCDWNVCREVGGLRLCKKKECKSLSNFMKRQSVYQICMSPDPARHQLKCRKCERWILRAQIKNVEIFDKE